MGENNSGMTEQLDLQRYLHLLVKMASTEFAPVLKMIEWHECRGTAQQAEINRLREALAWIAHFDEQPDMAAHARAALYPKSDK